MDATTVRHYDGVSVGGMYPRVGPSLLSSAAEPVESVTQKNSVTQLPDCTRTVNIDSTRLQLKPNCKGTPINGVRDNPA